MTDTVNVDLTAVIGWLENGCAVEHAITELKIYQARLASAPKAEPVSDTDALIDRFAHELKAKLNKAAQKYGFSDDWTKADWRDELVAQLLQHVTKGDPRDVAAYCAFAWHHGWSLTPEAPKELVRVIELAKAWLDRQGVQTLYDDHPAILINGLLRHLATHPAPASDELLEALEKSCRGWSNIIEFGLLQSQHIATAEAMRDELWRLIAKHKGPQS